MKRNDNRQEPVKVLEVATFNVRPPCPAQQSLLMLLLRTTAYFS